MRTELEGFMEDAAPELTEMVLGIADTVKFLKLALADAGVIKVSEDTLVTVAAAIITSISNQTEVAQNLLRIAGPEPVGDEPTAQQSGEGDDEYGF